MGVRGEGIVWEHPMLNFHRQTDFVWRSREKGERGTYLLATFATFLHTVVLKFKALFGDGLNAL